MIFVDTGAWFAAFVPNDPDHAQASHWIRNNVEGLITTDYILDELLTLLRVRGEFERALQGSIEERTEEERRNSRIPATPLPLPIRECPRTWTP